MNRSRMQGMTLVELMVSMVLGLIVIGGAVSLTLANRQSYRANEGLSQVEESARMAFELLARDIRQAGASGCDNEGRISNVLNGVEWWAPWFGVRGFDDSEPTSTSFAAYGEDRAERVEGTDAIQLQGLLGNGLSVSSHNATTAVITMSGASTDMRVGDVVMACNFDHAAIFEITAAAAPYLNLTHDTGAGLRNCSRGLGFPTDCSTATGNSYELTRNTQLWRLFAVDWYIGQSDREGDSASALFRRRLGNAGVETTEEIVSGITDMQISYRLGETNEFEEADAGWTLTDWGQVNAVRIALTAESSDGRIATGGSDAAGRLQRDYVQTITLRNRVQ